VKTLLKLQIINKAELTAQLAAPSEDLARFVKMRRSAGMIKGPILIELCAAAIICQTFELECELNQWAVCCINEDKRAAAYSLNQKTYGAIIDAIQLLPIEESIW